jgi:hypothetical protein
MLAATRLQLLTRNRETCFEIELQGELNVMTGPRLVALIDAGLANPAFHAFQISAHHLRSVALDVPEPGAGTAEAAGTSAPLATEGGRG